MQRLNGMGPPNRTGIHRKVQQAKHQATRRRWILLAVLTVSLVLATTGFTSVVGGSTNGFKAPLMESFKRILPGGGGPPSLDEQETVAEAPETPQRPARPETPLTPQWPPDPNIAFPFTGGPAAPFTYTPQSPLAHESAPDAPTTPDMPDAPNAPHAPAPSEPQRPDVLRVEELPPPAPDESVSNRLEPRPEAGEREVTEPAQSARILVPRERPSEDENGDGAEEHSPS